MRRIYELDITVESIRRTSSDTDSRDENLRRKVDSLRLVRDRFIIGAFTGLRVSDYGRLSEANIGADTIRIKTTKTGAVVVVPIHPWVRNILRSGFDASIHISDQKMNKHLKEIAKMAGIDEEITLNKNVGGKNEQRTFRKYELVHPHCAPVVCHKCLQGRSAHYRHHEDYRSYQGIDISTLYQSFSGGKCRDVEEA